MILALASLTAALAGAPPASDSFLNAPGRRYAANWLHFATLSLGASLR